MRWPEVAVRFVRELVALKLLVCAHVDAPAHSVRVAGSDGAEVQQQQLQELEASLAEKNTALAAAQRTAQEVPERGMPALSLGCSGAQFPIEGIAY